MLQKFALYCILPSLTLAPRGHAAEPPRHTVELADTKRTLDVDLWLLPSRTVDVRDPTQGGRRLHLSAVRVADVLARLPAPTGADALLVRCDDGYAALVTLDEVRRHDPMLAVADLGPHGGVPLAAPRGPAFLVWPHGGVPDGDWTFAVARLEYARAAEVRAALAPRDGKPRDAAVAIFAERCFHCHAVHGVGGMVGFDLSSPNIVAARRPDRVARYIADPRSVNRDGNMPAFRGVLKPVDIARLVDYLGAL